MPERYNPPPLPYPNGYSPAGYARTYRELPSQAASQQAARLAAEAEAVEMAYSSYALVKAVLALREEIRALRLHLTETS